MDLQKGVSPERQDLIQFRAEAILDQAITEQQDWALALGSSPGYGSTATTWRKHAQTVAAYRDRYGITAKTPLGPAPDSDAQKIDAVRAQAAISHLRELATTSRSGDAQSPAIPREGTRRGL